MAEKIRNLSFVKHNNQEIPRVPTELCFADRLGGWKVRWGVRRMKYAAEPGVYAVGNPDCIGDQYSHRPQVVAL